MLRTPDFEEFVHATGTRMLRTALLLCGDHQNAEDLTQTTYAKVFARWRLVSRAEKPGGLHANAPMNEASAGEEDVRLALLDALAQLSAKDHMQDAVGGTGADLDRLTRDSRRQGLKLRRYRQALSGVGVVAAAGAIFAAGYLMTGTSTTGTDPADMPAASTPGHGWSTAAFAP